MGLLVLVVLVEGSGAGTKEGGAGLQTAVGQTDRLRKDYTIG